MIYLVDLEYVETRYTAQWKVHFPEAIRNAGAAVTVIDGPDNIAECATPGAFLNFSGTNIYKSEQVRKIAELFHANKVQPGDKFVFADAWHPGIINLKYMSQLLGVPVETHGLWHAGSYDPNDFLGAHRYQPWLQHAEKSFYHAYDYNWFASHDHKGMFNHYFGTDRTYRTGWPMDYLIHEIVHDTRGIDKEDVILFPHRLAVEKQPEIFRDMQKHLPEYTLVIAQDESLTKAEYHKLLGSAKMVFSANLQETLGIGCYEILCAGGMPLVPDALSYSEMYSHEFKYPSDWTASFAHYEQNREELLARIRQMMTFYDDGLMLHSIDKNYKFLTEEYFSADGLINVLKGEE